MFASIMMIMIGIFHAIWGLTAVIDPDFFVVTDNYTFKLSTAGWGWIHLIAGIVILLAGFSLYSGAVWARTVAVILALVSAVASFFSIPYYPLWSILIVAIDVFIIWAVTAHGRDMGRME